MKFYNLGALQFSFCGSIHSIILFCIFSESGFFIRDGSYGGKKDSSAEIDLNRQNDFENKLDLESASKKNE